MAGFDAYDFGIEIVKNHTTGETTVHYEKTPEQVVTDYREKGYHLWVAHKSCADCILTPERCITNAHARKVEADFRSLHISPECAVGAVARFRNTYDVPDCIHCYAYYYQHWYENKYLSALKEADLIAFWDMTNMETVKESALIVTGYNIEPR